MQEDVREGGASLASFIRGARGFRIGGGPVAFTEAMKAKCARSDVQAFSPRASCCATALLWGTAGTPGANRIRSENDEAANRKRAQAGLEDQERIATEPDDGPQFPRSRFVDNLFALGRCRPPRVCVLAEGGGGCKSGPLILPNFFGSTSVKGACDMSPICSPFGRQPFLLGLTQPGGGRVLCSLCRRSSFGRFHDMHTTCTCM